MFWVFIRHDLNDSFLKLLLHLPIWLLYWALMKHDLSVILSHAAFHWCNAHAGAPPHKIIIESFSRNQLPYRCSDTRFDTLRLILTVVSHRLYIIQWSELIWLTAVFEAKKMLVVILCSLCGLLLLNNNFPWDLLWMAAGNIRLLFFDDKSFLWGCFIWSGAMALLIAPFCDLFDQGGWYLAQQVWRRRPAIGIDCWRCGYGFFILDFLDDAHAWDRWNSLLVIERGCRSRRFWNDREALLWSHSWSIWVWSVVTLNIVKL